MTSPRRIGIEAQRVLRNTPHGMDVATLNLIRSLLKCDQYNQYTVYLDRPDVNNRLGSWPNLTKSVIRCPNHLLWEQVALPMALLRDRLDLIHFTSGTGPLLWFGPTVVTVHDVHFLKPLEAMPSKFQLLGRLYRQWTIPSLVRRARAVFTVSQSERLQIEHHLGRRGVQVVHNGVGAPFTTVPAGPTSGIRVPNRYFLFLGNEHPKKNSRRALAAWAGLKTHNPDAPDLVVTELPAQRVRQMLTELGYLHLANHVICPGFIQQDDLRALYAGAVALVYPSLYESFGLPILEAFASGTAVITSDKAALREVASDAAIFVEPKDVGLLAQAMQTISTDEPYRQCLIQLGQQRVCTFTWDRTAEQTVRAYAHAL